MEEEITLKDMFQILKRRFAIILASIILITAVGGGFSILLNEQEYSSTTSLLVGEEKEIRVDDQETVVENEDGEEEIEPVYETIVVYGNTVISRQVASLYNEIIQRRDLAERVVENLDLDMSPGQLKSSIRMEIPSDSGIIELTVRGISMSNADEIVNEISNVFMDLVFEITEVETIRVMNPASKPIVTNTQNIKLNTAISAVLGFMVGIFLAFIFEYLDDRIRTEDYIEKKLGLEVMGKISNGSEDPEAYRTMRTNIEFSNKFKDKKALVITSASEENKNGEISLHLSKVMAKGDKKVLLVDADLRKPSIDKELNLSDNKGLADILLAKVDLDECINTYGENANLHILTSGDSQENAAELLSSQDMKKFLSRVRSTYDYIVLSSHPVHDISDSVALSALADGAILILNPGLTREGEAERAKKALEKVGANIVGSILN